jgi:hypothetical protein
MALGASKNPMTPALLWFSSDQTKDVFWSSGRWHWNPVRTASIRNSNLIVSDVAITNSGKRLYGTVIISGINPDFSGITLSLLFAPIWVVSLSQYILVKS